MKGKVIFAVLMMTGLFLQSIARGELIGHWTFDTDATASVGPDGTFKGSATVSATAIAGAGSLSLPATNDLTTFSYVRLDGGDGVTNDGNGFVGVAGGDDRTLSLWMKGGTQETQPFFAGWGDTELGSRVRYDLGTHAATTDQLRNELNAGAITSDTGTPILNDAWHHVAVTLESGTTTFYLDGVAYGSATETVNTITSHDMVIGTGVRQAGFLEGLTTSGGTDRLFDGLIDDVQVYDEALSAAQIGSLFTDPGSIIEFIPLTLQIDELSGQVKLINNTGADVDLDLYKINSPSGSLLFNQWDSLQSQDLAAFPAGDGSGNGWEETGVPSALLVSEAFLQGSSVLAAGNEIDLGDAYDVNNSDLSIQLEYHDVLADATFLSDAVYVSTLLGDLNNDGSVTSADVNPFVQALTDRVAYDANNYGVDADVAGDFNGNGKLDLGDISGFKSAVPGVGSASSSAVPEPSTLLMLVLGSLALGRRRR